MTSAGKAADTAADKPVKGRRRLLVVEDEADFRRILRDHFEDLGYEIEEAVDGREALDFFLEHGDDIDLVLTDIRMPRMDGEALIRELRKLRRHLPIIGVTGQADLAGKLAFLDQGAYYYLEKPLPQWAIVDRVVENAIRLHSYEEHVHRSRAKETEIARLLRSYLMRGVAAPAPGMGHAIELEIAVEHIENDLPGGDFSEHFHRGPDEVVLYVADASGHADLVSCFMACLASMVLHRGHHHDAHPGSPPGVDHMIRQVDNALHHLRVDGALGHERFVTLFLAVVDLARSELIYVNAGHPEAFLVRGGQALRLESTSRPAGFLFDTPPKIGRIDLRAGDLLFVYSDGACEMLEDGSGARSGIDHLASMVTAATGVSSVGVCWSSSCAATQS